MIMMMCLSFSVVDEQYRCGLNCSLSFAVQKSKQEVTKFSPISKMAESFQVSEKGYCL